MTTFTWDADTNSLDDFDSTIVETKATLANIGRLHTHTFSEYQTFDGDAWAFDLGQVAIGIKDVFGAGGATDGITYVRFYLKETTGNTPSGGGARLLTFLDTTGTVDMGSVYLWAVGGTSPVVLWFGDGFSLGQVIPTRPYGLDTWHLVEFLFVSGPDGYAIGTLDGAWFSGQQDSGFSDTGSRVRTILFGTWNNFGGEALVEHVPGIRWAVELDVQLDHLYVSDDTGVGWPGPAPESGTPPKGGVFFLDGFEHGTTTGMAFVGGTEFPTIDAAIKRSGEYSLKCNSGLSALPSLFSQQNTPPASEILIRAAFKFTHLPASKIPIVQLYDDSSTAKSALLIDAAGRLWADADATDGTDTGGITLSPGNWYALDLYFYYFGTDGTWTLHWRVRDDSTGRWHNQTSDVSTGHSRDWLRGRLIRLGWVTSPGASKILHLDDVVMSFHGSDWPFDMGSVQAIRPNNNSVHADSADFWQTTDDGVTQDSIDTTAWEMIDDDPLGTDDAVAQFVQSITAFQPFGFEGPVFPNAAGASQLTAFTRSQILDTTVWAIAYSDGTYESRTANISAAPEFDGLKRTDFPMTLGVGSSTYLPKAWIQEVLNLIGIRFGYSPTAFSGGQAARLDAVLIQSIYPDEIIYGRLRINNLLGLGEAVGDPAPAIPEGVLGISAQINLHAPPADTAPDTLAGELGISGRFGLAPPE